MTWFGLFVTTYHSYIAITMYIKKNQAELKHSHTKLVKEKGSELFISIRYCLDPPFECDNDPILYAVYGSSHVEASMELLFRRGRFWTEER